MAEPQIRSRQLSVEPSTATTTPERETKAEISPAIETTSLELVLTYCKADYGIICALCLAN